MRTVELDGNNLTLNDLVDVSRRFRPVAFSPKTISRVRKCRLFLERLVKENKRIYGVTTGFGGLGHIAISREKASRLQLNLIRSHSSSVGEPMPTDHVRAMMLLRANTLAKGHSGIRPQVLQLLAGMLNRRVHPIIPSQGSVGASGDLSPLSHMTLVMLGEADAEVKGRRMPGDKALSQAHLQAITLTEKEGLALNNGTQQTTAYAALALHDFENLLIAAEASTALAYEALGGIVDALDPRIHQLRPHKGQSKISADLRSLLRGSRHTRTGKTVSLEQNEKPQDPYSLRCAPQVLGIACDVLDFASGIVAQEMNSATDNPLFFPEDNAYLSGGNFHAQPVSVVLDFLGICGSIIANLSERQTARLLEGETSLGLKRFLVHPNSELGLSSGLMSAQYVAAALASENKVLSHPASVDTIPTSGGFEDFVSMGPGAGVKTLRIIRNTQRVVSAGLVTAAQAIDVGPRKKLGGGTRAVYMLVRRMVKPVVEDRSISSDIEALASSIANGELQKQLGPMLAN